MGDNLNIYNIFSFLFGAGGIGYAIVTRLLDKKKYDEEVRSQAADTDIKTDEFWKNRYDVLNEEMKNKDNWWKERYDNLYEEMQNERKMSNEIIQNFRIELNQIRDDYETQRAADKRKYEDLKERYEALQEESERKVKTQLERIAQLEKLLNEYESRNNNDK